MVNLLDTTIIKSSVQRFCETTYENVGLLEGALVGDEVGSPEGALVGEEVGSPVGNGVGGDSTRKVTNI